MLGPKVVTPCTRNNLAQREEMLDRYGQRATDASGHSVLVRSVVQQKLDDLLSDLEADGVDVQ